MYEGIGCTAIARDLNRKGIPRNGKLWFATNVHKIITNPKYAGWNVWNRSSERLQTKRIQHPGEQWIVRRKAFLPIVDQETYDQAQLCRPKRADCLWSDGEMLQRVRRLLKLKGRLSERLILRARGMPSTATLHSHFGPYRRLYEMVGYHLEAEDIYKGAQSERSWKLRRKIVDDTKGLLQEHVTVTHLTGRTRSVLLIDDTFMVSVLLCRSKLRRGALA